MTSVLNRAGKPALFLFLTIRKGEHITWYSAAPHFLLAFLPLVAILYYICPRKLRNGLLLIFSLLFYGWGEPKYILIMLFSTVFDYCNGLAIGHFRSKEGRAAPRRCWSSLWWETWRSWAFQVHGFCHQQPERSAGHSHPGAGAAAAHRYLLLHLPDHELYHRRVPGLVPPQRNIVDFGAYVTLFPS